MGSFRRYLNLSSNILCHGLYFIFIELPDRVSSLKNGQNAEGFVF